MRNKLTSYLDTNWKTWAPTVITLGYLIIGSLWILFSDQLLARRAPTMEAFVRWQIYKGWGYVIVTTGLLYGVIRIYASKWQQVEEALRESERRFRRAVVESPYPTMLHAEDGEVMLINEVWSQITGYISEEIPTIAAWTEKAYGDAQEQVQADIDRLYELNKKVDEGEYVITTSTGERRTWQFSSAPLGALPDSRRLIITIAIDVTERQRMEDALRRRNRELLLLHKAAQTLGATLDLEKVFSTVLQTMRELLGVTACSLWLVDPETGELVCHEASGGGRDVVLGWRLAPVEGLAGWVAEHAESVIVADASHDERHVAEVNRQTGLMLRAIISVPLYIKGKTLGVIQAVDESKGRFGKEDLALLESFTTSATIAIENARLFDKAQQEIAAREKAEEELRRHRDHLEEVVNERTTELRMLVNAMTGREVRMAELKDVIRQLRKQLREADLEPVADDPLLGEED